MNHFVVSARKYRPTKFSEVVGQQPITVTLKNAVVTGHIAQAYLFCGPRGVGKTTVARILAKAINCSNPKENGEPCNQCESCHAFDENRSFNIHELDAASNNKVEDIKSLIDKVRIPPQMGQYSVYIIDEVHMLSAQAFNAFLKTLEEPPDYAVFILATTEKQKIIPTILSRCQIYDFQRIQIDDIMQQLKYVADEEKVEIDEESIHIIARKADGALRDALSSFDQLVSFSGNQLTYEKVIENLNVLDVELYFRLTDMLSNGDFREAVQLLDQILLKGFDIRDLISGLASHFRELLMARDKATHSLMEVGKAMKEKYIKQSKAVDEDFLIQALGLCYEADVTLRNSRNQRLHTEMMLLRICGLKKKPGNLETTSAPTSSSETAEKERPKKPVSPSQVSSSPSDKEPSQLSDSKKDKVKPELPKAQKKDTEATASTKEDGTVEREYQPGNTGQPPTAAEESEHTDEKSISIKTALKGISDANGVATGTVAEKVAEDTREYTEEDKEFTIEALTREWLNYADSVDKPRFSSALRTHLPRLSPPATIEVAFENNNLKEDFERNLKNDLQDFLVQQLHNRMIHFDIRVLKGDAREKKPYTSEEKYAQLKAKNPEIDNLRRQFNLDFE